MKQKLLQIIKEWGETMVEQFNWLTIKYEYSEFYRTVLVSFSPLEIIDNDDDFNRDTLIFEDAMTAEFGDDAPLFTNEEKLFTLSDDALIISKNATSNVTSNVTSYSGMEVNAAYGLMLPILQNWLDSSSYDQEESLEMASTIKNNSEDYLEAA